MRAEQLFQGEELTLKPFFLAVAIPVLWLISPQDAFCVLVSVARVQACSLSAWGLADSHALTNLPLCSRFCCFPSDLFAVVCAAQCLFVADRVQMLLKRLTCSLYTVTLSGTNVVKLAVETDPLALGDKLQFTLAHCPVCGWLLLNLCTQQLYLGQKLLGTYPWSGWSCCYQGSASE